MSGTVNPLTVTSLYRKVILQSSLYGCELWNELSISDTKKLSQLQHFLVKEMQGFVTRTRSDMCESMLGLLEIVREIDKRKLLFFCKLCHLEPAKYVWKPDTAISFVRFVDFHKAPKRQNNNETKWGFVDISFCPLFVLSRYTSRLNEEMKFHFGVCSFCRLP